MHAHHLHTGIEQEDTAGQYDIVQLCQIREETLRHVHIIMSASGDVDDAQDYEKACRDDCADHSSPFAYLAYPTKTFHRDEGG